MEALRKEIEEMVDRETRAWNTQNVELLLSIFHPDFVWVWPENARAHDPIGWKVNRGKFDYERYKRIYEKFFSEHTLKRNVRTIKKIVVSRYEDGAFAVVDIDTLWIDKEGEEDNWKGRVCKVYAKTGKEWKMTMHTGVLDYTGPFSQLFKV